MILLTGRVRRVGKILWSIVMMHGLYLCLIVVNVLYKANTRHGPALLHFGTHTELYAL